MHIEIRGHVKATAAIRRHVERRVQTAVGRFSHRVRAVTIRLDDINGPEKGGADKACRLRSRSPAGGARPWWWKKCTPISTGGQPGRRAHVAGRPPGS